LKDTDVRARRGAIDVLEALGPAAAPAGAALVQALHDSDQFVRWAAARTLGKISPVQADTAVPGLGRLLADLDLDVRLAAAMALERYGPAARAALPELIRAMRASDAELRVAAMRAVAVIGGVQAHAAIPALTDGVTDADSRVRQVAAEVLGNFGPAARKAVDALNQALQDTDPDVQRAAGEALLNIKRQSKK
jgi:HEAT repeat protein